MSNKYSPTIESGDVRVRIRAGHFFNPQSAPPTISGLECEVVRLADGSERQLGDTRMVTLTYTPGNTYPIRNPQTDEDSGTTGTDGQLFALLYSRFRQAQLDLDSQGQQP